MYTLTRNHSQGGLRLVDMGAKRDTLQIVSALQCENDDFLRECMYAELCPTLGSLIWKCNLSPQDVVVLFNPNGFWTYALKAWAKVNFLNPTTPEEIKSQIIWRNSHIKQAGKPLLWELWINNHILFVGDLLDPHGHWLSWEKLREKYSEVPHSQWLNYIQILKCMPVSWSSTLKATVKSDKFEFLYDKCHRRKKISPMIYNMLIHDNSVIVKYWKSWEKDGLVFDSERYKNAFSMWKRSTKITKLRDFQYRLLLNKVVCNDRLHEWGMVENNLCTFCNEARETVTHLLYNCKKVRSIIQFVNELMYVCDMEDLNLQTFLLNDMTPVHVLNEVLMVVKQRIYANRCANQCVCLTDIIKAIYTVYQCQMFSCRGNQKESDRVLRKWSPIVDYITY